MNAERIAEIRNTLAEWDALTEPGDPGHFCLAAKLLAAIPELVEAFDAATKRAEDAEKALELKRRRCRTLTLNGRTEQQGENA